MNIEDFLGDLDKSFAEKTQQEVYMIYVAVATALIAFSYLLLWDSAEQGFNRTLAQTKVIEKKITEDEKFLRFNPENKIYQLKADTTQYKQDFITVKDQAEYIKYKIEQISSLYYDEQAWGEFIDSIAESSKKYGVQLKYLSNEFSSDKNTFGHVLDIEVKVKGSFHKTMKFINSLEQSFLVVDIHDLNLSSSSKIDTNLQISVWGITY
ncbi:type 4a pilus biogenesis protein PilO [Sulfurimonas sp. MAG313]|nr:type 4a pilus biogenesis protein PilO [Sulfurimonas sp. MAG313]MDF1881885.1 type 4a pilus biogenesis protein PilO [Sulfurimonas sp. MAG313]